MHYVTLEDPGLERRPDYGPLFKIDARTGKGTYLGIARGVRGIDSGYVFTVTNDSVPAGSHTQAKSEGPTESVVSEPSACDCAAQSCAGARCTAMCRNSNGWALQSMAAGLLGNWLLAAAPSGLLPRATVACVALLRSCMPESTTICSGNPVPGCWRALQEEANPNYN